MKDNSEVALKIIKEPHIFAWITWERQTRNVSMANILNIPLYELISDAIPIIRYIKLTFLTIKLIKKKKVTHLFVQNPSIVLSAVSVVAGKLFNLKIFIDAHNSGVFPLEGKYKIIQGINRKVLKYADLVIVTNSYLANTLASWGIKNTFVMPDPIPRFKNVEKRLIYTRPYILFVCTWAKDEPYYDVIEAARLLNNGIDIYITGNYKQKISEDIKNSLPKNVSLLGFVSQLEYVNYLNNASLIVDLTTRENCLVCGAYEAIALKKPAIVSDTRVNREVFKQGFIYSKNYSKDIASSISEAYFDYSKLTNEIFTSYQEHIKCSTSNALRLKKLIGLPYER